MKSNHKTEERQIIAMCPRLVWRIAKKHLPNQAEKKGPGRSRKPNHPVLNGNLVCFVDGMPMEGLGDHLV